MKFARKQTPDTFATETVKDTCLGLKDINHLLLKRYYPTLRCILSNFLLYHGIKYVIRYKLQLVTIRNDIRQIGESERNREIKI